MLVCLFPLCIFLTFELCDLVLQKGPLCDGIAKSPQHRPVGTVSSEMAPLSALILAQRREGRLTGKKSNGFHQSDHNSN